MRPQHITAENHERAAEWGAADAASMRPQHITAENRTEQRVLPRSPVRFNEAAAYHCGKPRGWIRRPGTGSSFNEAAAYHCGKPRGTRWSPATTSCFNEAAAYHCGKPRTGGVGVAGERAASMRPQHITAENRSVGRWPLSGGGRFNEAAAYHCGKPWTRAPGRHYRRGLQ